MSGHVSSGAGRRWHDHITIDLFVKVLANSLFHPFVAWIIPLCFRAVQAPYESPKLIASCAWASLMTVLWMLSIINKRVAYGLPREVDWDEEVVVITGGAGGLGKIIAEMYGMRGASVAVLDVTKPDQESEGMESVRFYHCDVGDADAVMRAKEQIEKDFGPPTILINNAGILNGKPMWELSDKDVRRNFNVHLIAHFNTIRTFLPGMFDSEIGGTIVTVASMLGKIGASHLSDYCAAKAGLIAMHASLRGELLSPAAPEGAENVRTILVTPGQLATQMFYELETPSNFLGPIVEPVELAREIVRMIDAGESGEISLPFYANCIEFLKIVPAGMDRIVRQLSGVDRAMERVYAMRKEKSK